MNDAQILNKINSFAYWYYQFDLAGHKTPVKGPDVIRRNEQRKNYFFRPLVDLLGGSLAGKRVLDLGCNAGFWSLCAIESGCDYVVGIDGRQMHIDQAEFVFEVKGIERDRYHFYCGNVFDLLNENLGQFDIVLCLGLLYHISKPITLLERISSINTDLLVIDSILSKKEGSVFEVRHGNLDHPLQAVDYELVLSPTRAAVLDMVRQFGYHVAILKRNFTDYASAPLYMDASRLAFMCAKQTDLAPLDVEGDLPEDIDVASSAGRRHAYLMQIPARELVQALVSKAVRRLRRGQRKQVVERL